MLYIAYKKVLSAFYLVWLSMLILEFCNAIKIQVDVGILKLSYLVNRLLPNIYGNY